MTPASQNQADQTDEKNLQKANVEHAASEGNKAVSSDARSAPQTSDPSNEPAAQRNTPVQHDPATGVGSTRQAPLGRPYESQGDSNVATEQGLTTTEGRKAQIERTARELDKRSADNEEGQSKLLEAEQKRHEENKNRGELSEGDGERKVPENPTSGLEYNRNTPRMDKAGNKIWD